MSGYGCLWIEHNLAAAGHRRHHAPLTGHEGQGIVILSCRRGQSLRHILHEVIHVFEAD